MVEKPDLFAMIAAAMAARSQPADEWAAQRLFNGYVEGYPDLVIDRYAHTLVIFNQSNPPEAIQELVKGVKDTLLLNFPQVRAIIIKERYAVSPEDRNGRLMFGSRADRKIREDGVWYALDLQLNQDASFYLDTRGLRAWLRANAAGKNILNTFAYTGSLGVAALAGGAQRVVQVDLNRRFLNVAKDSCALNGLGVRREDYLAGDFYPLTARLRRENRLFDGVILDPPYFSSTTEGNVDLAGDFERLLNKARPLVADGGWLALVNNALFLSGNAYLRRLDALCADGYMQVETRVNVPEDCAGFAGTRQPAFPADPAPFNHPTKIVILRLRRKAMPKSPVQ